MASSAHRSPGFRFRGTKGWNWTAQQYLEEIPTLVTGKMNFLMNCYLSMYSDQRGYCNEWWLPIPEEKRRSYAQVIRSSHGHGIHFCFAMHPQLHSPRPLDPTSDTDLDTLYSHFAWALSEGTRWFCVALDDIGGVRIDPAEHARLANTLLDRLRQRAPEAQMIFCPTHYWGDGTADHDRPYLQTLAQALDPSIYVFWTGREVCAQTITRRDADTYRSIVGHRLFIWDNYPVNDGYPTLHLGPVSGRDPDLHLVADGYMGNPMCPQNEANRIPLLTCADYAYDPANYDPARSIAQAITRLAATDAQRQTLEQLVKAYPGMLACGQMQSSFNAVRHRAVQLRAVPAQLAAFRAHLERVLEQLRTHFPGRYQDAAAILAQDLRSDDLSIWLPVTLHTPGEAQADPGTETEAAAAQRGKDGTHPRSPPRAQGHTRAQAAPARRGGSARRSGAPADRTP